MTANSRAKTNSTSTKGEGKKITAESQIRSNGRKRKRTGLGNNVQGVHGICAGDPLGIFHNSLCTGLRQPNPPERVYVATSLFRRDRLYIAHLLEGNYFTNAARSRINKNPLSRKTETIANAVHSSVHVCIIYSPEPVVRKLPNFACKDP